MFTPAPELRHVAVTPERVVAIIESINSPNVVLPGTDAEPTQAFIVGVRNQDATFSVYIYLYQPQSNRPAIYLCEPRSIALAQYPETEAEAIQFVESMGFMVDNLNFRRQPPERQSDIFQRTPAFHADLSRFASAKEVPAALEGLEELEELEELGLDALEPLGDTDLPVVPAQLAGLEMLPPTPLTGPAAAKLTDEDRQRLARLLAAF